MDSEPDQLNDLTRDAYAHFGLAYYLSECMFEGLVHVVATSGVAVTRGAIEERTKHLRSEVTLGLLVNTARESIPAEFHRDLDRAVDRRNDLAHGFWFEHVHQMTSVEGIEVLIRDLQKDQELFRAFSQLTDDLVMPRLAANGMTEERWEQAMVMGRGLPPEPDLARALPRVVRRVVRSGDHHARS